MYFLKRKGLALLVFVLTLVTQEAAYSQLFFTKGYVVLASGDTLKGDIRERGNQLIELRSQGDNAVHEYTPSQPLIQH
ncbi:hypothetical protein [Spirosoma sp. KNUC1025]|uniref:hypothetical protein n=1 Tax=Spirosoma sp. KNUC1025 TaxID=2894082 RepID=UPI003867CACC|nr:hypothetical protein LN737_29305 [Spirosoma sp. KNUC1025]